MSRIVALILALTVAVTTRSLAQGDPRSALLERDGWNALAAGNLRGAADSFREAASSDPKNPTVYLGAATAAFLERRNEDARVAVEQALQLDPTLTPASELLGQLQYRMGDLDGAIHTYQALAARAPDDKPVVEGLERWEREVDLRDRMEQAINAHFTVSFDGPAEADVAAKALESLDRAFFRVGDTLGAFPSAPVAVVLYTGEQFKDITRSPSWAVGAYDGTIRVPMRGALDSPEELDRVLAHEYVHALVRTLAPRGVPTWLNEGLATALESSDGAQREWRIGQAAGPTPLAALPKSFESLSGPQAQFAYAASALAVHRLIEEAGGFAVANLLRDLGEGADFNAAFAHRIERPFADFQASLTAY